MGTGNDWTDLPEDAIEAARRVEPGRSRSTTGYGPKQPTGLELLVDGRWRKVWCAIWSNMGTTYIMLLGERRLVSPYTFTYEAKGLL